MSLRHRWWALRNWLLGYQFGPVRRFRCCGHTTPFHHWRCLVSDGGEDRP